MKFIFFILFFVIFTVSKTQKEIETKKLIYDFPRKIEPITVNKFLDKIGNSRVGGSWGDYWTADVWAAFFTIIVFIAFSLLGACCIMKIQIPRGSFLKSSREVLKIDSKSLSDKYSSRCVI
ncbi:hypothetical protein M0811_08418 [Anaeramoeba ignava]|uniref:Uncharacterized protein n=1 Tax=Anaeramoeba ignava TaxID=1746090 RepID=A0A9Q0LHR1_ANAIG|nr:hypothetical protein M0811_08418 [Anaeramoeba ignava]